MSELGDLIMVVVDWMKRELEDGLAARLLSKECAGGIIIANFNFCLYSILTQCFSPDGSTITI